MANYNVPQSRAAQLGADPISFFLRPLEYFENRARNKEIMEIARKAARTGLDIQKAEELRTQEKHEAEYSRPEVDWDKLAPSVKGEPARLATTGEWGLAFKREARAQTEAEHAKAIRGVETKLLTKDKYNQMLGFLGEQGLSEVIGAGKPLWDTMSEGIGAPIYKTYEKLNTILSVPGRREKFVANLRIAQGRTPDENKKQVIENMIQKVENKTFLQEVMPLSWTRHQEKIEEGRLAKMKATKARGVEKLPIRPETVADLTPSQRRNFSNDFQQAKEDGTTEATTLDGFLVEREIFPPREEVPRPKKGEKDWRLHDPEAAADIVPTAKAETRKPTKKKPRQLASGFTEEEKERMRAVKKAGREAIETIGRGAKKATKFLTERTMSAKMLTKLKKKFPDTWEIRKKAYEERRISYPFTRKF